jgi:hypothetical protein
MGSVVCDEGRVTSINLSNNWLYGTLPTEIGQLTELSYLNLYANQLSGSLPAEITNLSNLQSLNIGGNLITGQLPAEIGNLSQLKHMFIDNNNFEGAVPQDILALSQLEILAVSENHFSSLPDLNTLSNLDQLKVDNNALTFDDIIPIADFSGRIFYYDPQQKTGEIEYHTLADGNTLTLSTNITNNGNTYEWYKNNGRIFGATSATYEIASFSAADEGVYHCLIKNPALSRLTLYTQNIYVSSQSFYDTQFQVTHNGNALRYAIININSSVYETDENGIASLKLTDGSFDYTVSAFGMQDYTGTATVNGAMQTVDIQMQAMQAELYTLDLQITDGTTGVPNALVNIDGTEHTASQYGFLSVTLPTGVHAFNVSATNFIGESGTFFQPMEALTKQIVLTPLHKVAFTVTDGTNPLENATVLINNQTKTTDVEGKAEFWLIDGSYQYAVSAATFGNVKDSVTVNGSAENVTTTLSPGYEVAFSVSNPVGGIPNAAIEIGGFTYPCNETGEKSIMLSNGTYTYNILVGEVINKKGELTVNSAAQTVNVVLPFFAIVKENKTATANALSRQTYYDTNNDGILELFKYLEGTSANNFTSQIRHYADFQLSSTSEIMCEYGNSYYDSFEILNINNDNKPDFQVFYSGIYGQGPIRFVSQPDGTYLFLNLDTDKRPDIDIDLDGMPDWIEKDGEQLIFGQQHRANTFINKSFSLKQLDDFFNNYDYSAWNEPSVTTGLNSTGLPGGFSPIGFSYPPANTSKQMLIDYNQDGLPDIIDTKGVLFRNIGDDTFLEVPFYGKVVAKDLNGDFIADFIATKNDSVMALIYDGQGTYKRQDLITSSAVDDNIYIYDFDKDNDPDILLPFSFDTNETATFLVFFENDGNGNFTKHDTVFMEQWKIIQCADVNHDGYYDLLVDKVVESGGEYVKANQTFMLMGKAGFEFDVFDNGGKVGDYLLDFDNDGFYEGLTAGRTLSYQGDTVFHFGGIAPNTPPAKPAKPEIYLDRATGKLHINWKTVADDQSSTCDLTYALRIGSGSDKSDILYAHANANGTRRIKEDGNMGGNLSYSLNVRNWKAGDYYISVQAVDPMHSGSEWSEYSIMTHDLLFADFELSEKTIAPHDTLTLRFAGSRSDSYTFNWDFGTAVVIENTDNELIKLEFNSAGMHEISLMIENASGEKSEGYKQTVFVKPLDINVMNLDYIDAADFDGDGDIDLATTDGLYKNDGNANFTKLASIFNLTFEPGYALWEDYDHDGDPDLLYSLNDADDGQSGILINNGNSDFTEESKTFPDGFFTNFKADIDRDGNIDYFYRNKYYINNGDFTFTEKTMSNTNLYYKYSSISDLNNDNYVDVWVAKDDWLTFFINQKDGTFDEIPITLPDEFNNNTPVHAVRDFNNDNLPDVLVKKNSHAFHIFVNQGDNTFDYGKDIIFDFELHDPYVFADFDNNGTTDIAVENGEKAYIVLLDKDMNVQSGIETSFYIPFSVGEVKMTDLNGDQIADALHYVPTASPSNYSVLHNLMLHEGFDANTAPNPPQDIIAYQTENGITIKWQHGDDTETPQHKLQYNLSIKDINSGEYLFSAAVSNSDNVPPLLTRHYLSGNSLVLNKQLIPVGEYEIKMQTIDSWNAQSAFSETTNLNVTVDPAFDIPEFACAGSNVNITYTGNTGANTTFSWNFDGANVISGNDAGPYTVTWENGGLKNVTVEVTTDGNTESFMSGIGISQIYTATIEAADTMVAGIAETITLPAIPENSSDLIWTVPDGSVTHNDFDKTAQMVFNSAGEKIIEITWSENGCAAGTITDTITVLTALPIPQIDLVTNDHTSGGNIIRWTNNFDAHIEKALVFKERSLLNNFEQIAELDATTVSEFIDSDANTNQRANRYRMAVKDQWGHIGTPGNIHKTVHLAINKAMNGWNLYWNNYQGMPVSAYRVFRGTSPDNMTLLEQIPASTFSYTDADPPGGELFYSLEIVLQTEGSKGSVNSKSNYISTQQAFEPIYVNSVVLYSASGNTTITEAGDSLVILADILPANATLKNLVWEITSGSQFATIDQHGIVKPIEGQSGTVIVTAQSQDGSAESGTIALAVSTEVVVPNNAPEINNIATNPAAPNETDAVHISATVTDSDGAVEVVVLNWGVSSGSLTNQIAMTKGTSDLFTTSSAIPAQAGGNTVYYQITATDDDSESVTSAEMSYSVITGIANLHGNSIISLYPNPVKSLLHIEYEGETNFTISMFDIHGRTIELDTNYGEKSDEDTVYGRKLIDVGGLENGVYILKLVSKKGVFVKQFVKR